MSSFAVAVNKFVLSAASLLLFTMFSLGHVSAATKVSVGVCNSEGGSAINLTSPQSDSITDSSTVTLIGTASRTSQVTVEVDGQYDSTFALSPDDPSFNKQISLNSGTHTIVLIANDVCGQKSEQAQVVLTYQPRSIPSSGAMTLTHTGPTDNEGERKSLIEGMIDTILGNVWSFLIFILATISMIFFIVIARRRRQRKQD